MHLPFNFSPQPQPVLFDNAYTNLTACYQPINIVSAIGEWILSHRVKQDLTYDADFNMFRSTTEQSDGYDDHWPVNILAFLPHVLLLLVIIVATSHAIHFFLRRLKQSLFVSQLIAGILIYLFWNKGRHVDSVDHYMLFWPKNRRLEQALSNIGIFFNFFLMSLKIDASSAWRTGKTPFFIAVTGLSIPTMITLLAYFFLHSKLTDHVKSHYDFLYFVVAMLCHSFFFVQAEVLSELGLLSSELGRLALSASIIQDLFLYSLTPVFNSIIQSQYGTKKVILHLVFFPIMVAFIIFVVRPYALWVVRNTPSNGTVRDVHINVITLLVILVALASDIVGASYIAGPMYMGLALPSGLPLGSALIRRIDLVATELLLPLVFVVAGREMDWEAAGQDLTHGLWLGILVLVASVSKVATVAVTAFCCGLPLKGGALLGLSMNFKGIMETLVLIDYRCGKALTGATYTFFILLMLVTTLVSALLLSIFYKPLDKENNVCKNVSELKYQAELRIITCFFDNKPVSSLLDFLEWLTPSVAQHCTCVYAIHLKELKARSKSNLISHNKGKGRIDSKDMDPVHNHFVTFRQEKKDQVTIMPFTSIVPQANMHQDICSLIVERKVALVILPFPRKNSVADAEANQSMCDLIPLVLQLAQCSVGIMVYHSLTRITPNLQGRQFFIGVLFMGGPDDREAVAIASRMAYHPSTHLSILRFRTSSVSVSKGEGLEDQYDTDRTIDDEVIDQLQRENPDNDRLTISEVTIYDDAARIMSTINSLRDNYDMMIVGRRRGHSSLLDNETLVQWTDSPVLGVIGDLLASPDFKTPANILVVQQHGSS